MRIAFRTDASVDIGTGHVMRCLTLADELRQRGARCLFICRPHAGNLLDLIALRGHDVASLPESTTDITPEPGQLAHARWLGVPWTQDASQTRAALKGLRVDWLVVDHYAIDHRWETMLRAHCDRIMVIDDVADRPHDCDLLLDQNLGRAAMDYATRVKSTTELLLGPRYALLRPEFAEWRERSLSQREDRPLRRILVTMGGVDKDNMTAHILKELQASGLIQDWHVTVVLGHKAPRFAEVEALVNEHAFPCELLRGVTHMAPLMAESDVAIGAAGSTSWERCCMGLPTLQVVLAANQVDIAQALQRAGAAFLVEPSGLRASVAQYFGSATAKERLLTSGRAAAGLVDGLGAARVCDAMLRGLL